MKLPKIPLPKLKISPIVQRFLFLMLIVAIATVIAMPKVLTIHIPIPNNPRSLTLTRADLNLTPWGIPIARSLELKEGLDIQGGTQVVLAADMSKVPEADRATALESAREIIHRRVDLFGVSEPLVQTSQNGNDYRIVVELAGVQDTAQALQVIGQTAQLDFKLEKNQNLATDAAQLTIEAFLNNFEHTGLSGSMLKKASVQFDPQTSEPVVTMAFNEQGTELFRKITTDNVGKRLAIFLDEAPLMMPTINQPILSGEASITGQFGVEEAKQLAIQLNAGALPVPIQVIEQRSIGASLGQNDVSRSVKAGLVGIALVMIFMILYYGWRGVIASLSLLAYAVLTIATYKLVGVVLTLPGIAGLLLSVGMAVDSNILIFERLKEELRSGRPFAQALELAFGRAWDSIKDANVVTIVTGLILMNPLDLNFLNSSGLVRGFGITLLIGVLISLFTGLVVTRTLMKLFLQDSGAPNAK